MNASLVTCKYWHCNNQEAGNCANIAGTIGSQFQEELVLKQIELSTTDMSQLNLLDAFFELGGGLATKRQALAVRPDVGMTESEVALLPFQVDCRTDNWIHEQTIDSDTDL